MRKKDTNAQRSKGRLMPRRHSWRVKLAARERRSPIVVLTAFPFYLRNLTDARQINSGRVVSQLDQIVIKTHINSIFIGYCNIVTITYRFDGRILITYIKTRISLLVQSKIYRDNNRSDYYIFE